MKNHEISEINFNNLIITCDAKKRKTSIMIDGKECGERCLRLQFTHEAGERPVITMIKNIDVLPIPD